MHMKFIALFFCVAWLAGCATKPPATLRWSGDTAYYDGLTYTAAAAAFASLVNTQPIKRLVINSGGGHVGPAIDKALLIHQKGIEVVVRGQCYSSCANYIFPAGAKQIIADGSVVGWHGTVTHLKYKHQMGQLALNAEDLNEYKKLSAREKEFFQRIGVDGFIAWFGKIPPYGVRDTYLLSPQDMQRFGLRNLQVRQDYVQTNLSAFNRRDPNSLKFIEVDWAGFEAIRPQVQ